MIELRILLALVAALGAGQMAIAQVWIDAEHPRAQHAGNVPYDAFQAGRDSYLYHEADRQSAIRRQVELNDAMKWYGRGARPYDSAVYYRSRPNLESIYAYPPGSHPYGGTGVWGGLGVFEPWPVVPGDIWGFPYVRAVRQPIGQRQVQTGPNRWESHPIYAEPHGAPEHAGGVPHGGRWEPGPVDVQRPERRIPSPSPEQVPPRFERPGPREF